MKRTATVTVTAADYQRVFETERGHVYPMVDAIERETGYALDCERYTNAACVLACPVKRNPPSWQHGRVLYALTRQYLTTVTGPVQLLDIGTAKGYSALCLQWALLDAKVHGRVTSVDVIDPAGTARRNTVAECAGPVTLYQILEPWPEARKIDFLQMTGSEWLGAYSGRVHVAFVDGKHTFEAVTKEADLLAERQQSGDLAMFDDCQIEAVDMAVFGLTSYDVRYVQVLPNRKYAMARRK